MHFSNTLVISLLPGLGLATSYLRKSSNGDQAAMLMASNVQSNNLNNPNNPNNNYNPNNPNNHYNPNDPNNRNPNHHSNHNAGNAPGINDCGISSFIELTQNPANNPSVDDCQQMLWTIQQDQEWNVTSVGQTLVSFQTCAFNAVVSAGQPEYYNATIGNADIIDLVTDSITKYGKNGKVGCHGGFNMYVASAGAMPCDSPNLPSGEQVSVDWTLTHV